MDFENEDGQDVVENFKFNTVADFLIDNMTKNSPYLKELSDQKNFYNRMIKQLRSNKILQRALQNGETKAAMVEALQALLNELETYDKEIIE
ncbi:hypothetical protein [Bacteroides heparinolyticus]|uniref:hypothetical protein n=1 Tax=Prevotella heparinolytica TaxID=28113 RepID=UPI0035A056B8